jgi:ParB family chromosome partitioning protein
MSLPNRFSSQCADYHDQTHQPLSGGKDEPLATQNMPAPEQIFHIPLTDIQLSKTNPRSEIDEQELGELAADIRASRVQEPVLVRPLKGGKAKYELVFGERRFKASVLANKETIPTMVRELTDDEAQDAQITENLQRANLHPLDDAAVFQTLYDKHFKETRRHDDAIAQVAARVHKKPDHVARFLKFNDLVAAAKTAFRKNQILLGHAFELSRLREDEQKTAVQWMLGNQKEAKTEKGWAKQHIMPSVQELKLWVREHLFLDLSKAPFDTTDATLNPKMGACANCKFRSGNQPALFGDVGKGDICTVPSCWDTKRNATITNQATAVAQELGVETVLKVGLGYASWNSAKVPVDVYIEYGSDARLVNEGQECKSTKPGLVTWIGQSVGSGRLKVGDKVRVCPKASSCAKHQHADSRADRPKKSYEEMATTRISNLRKEVPQRVRAALVRAVIQAAQKERRSLSTSDKTKFALVARQMHQDLFFDRHRDLCTLMGVEPSLDRSKSKNWRGTSASMFNNNPLALMVAMTLMHCYHVGGYDAHGDPLKPLLQVYRVNAEALEKQTKADIQAKIAGIQGAVDRRKAKLGKSAKKAKSAKAANKRN